VKSTDRRHRLSEAMTCSPGTPHGEPVRLRGRPAPLMNQLVGARLEGRDAGDTLRGCPAVIPSGPAIR
jgi:hypothetical protein